MMSDAKLCTQQCLTIQTILPSSGWNAAFVYDSLAGSETTMQLLEYANSQLLEFRHYDDLLTRELAGVYDSLEKNSNFIGLWRSPREASRLQTMLLDVTELTERADNAIKFLSDMFSARLYRLAANKVGVHDYKSLTKENCAQPKICTAS